MQGQPSIITLDDMCERESLKLQNSPFVLLDNEMNTLGGTKPYTNATRLDRVLSPHSCLSSIPSQMPGHEFSGKDAKLGPSVIRLF